MTPVVLGRHGWPVIEIAGQLRRGGAAAIFQVMQARSRAEIAACRAHGKYPGLCRAERGRVALRGTVGRPWKPGTKA